VAGYQRERAAKGRPCAGGQWCCHHRKYPTHESMQRDIKKSNKRCPTADGNNKPDVITFFRHNLNADKKNSNLEVFLKIWD
jgi:hypothetical protein